MALPGYPVFDYNRGRELLAQLGTFWSLVFNGSPELQAHLRSSGRTQEQTYLDTLDAAACVSRFDVPVFHTENWTLLTIKRSQVEAVPAIYQPDDLAYGPQSGARPGRPAGYVHQYGASDSTTHTLWPLPETLRGADYTVQNKVVTPSKTWVRGIDYTVDDGRRLLIFRGNIFTDPLVVKRDVVDANGLKIDEEASLWLYHGDFDLDYVYVQFGYALGLHLDSSTFYKTLLNAYWDAHLLGPSLREIAAILSAAAGAPLVLEGTETVEVVRMETDSWLIATDLNVYRLPLSAAPAVAVGDVLHAGDVLSDAVEITELSCSNPDYSALPLLSVGPRFLSGGFIAELIFHNESVPLEYVGADSDGKAVVKFSLGGHPADVERFFNQLQANGKAAGQTLAELLDIRTNPTGEPTADNLPATINPLEFLLSNLMRNNLFVIRVRPDSFAANAPGLQMFSLLRNIMPPHVSYVALIDLAPDTDTMDLSDVDSVVEDVGKFKGAAVLEEAAPTSVGGTDLQYEDILVSAKQVSVTCL